MSGGYDGSIRVKYDIDTKDADSRIMKQISEIRRTEAEISRLKSRMKELEGTRLPISEYQQMQKELQKAESEADSLYGKLRVMEKSGDTTSQGYRRLVNQIAYANQHINSLREGMQALESSGRAFIPGNMSNEYQKAAQKVAELNDRLKVSKQRVKELANKQKEVKGGFSKMSDASRKFASIFTRDTRKSANTLKSLTSRMKNMLLSLLVFGQITKAFNAMVTAMKAGFENLAQYSGDYNTAMSQFKSQTEQLKNSLAAAFEPLANMVLPYLTQFIAKLNTACESVSRFLAYLGGKDTYTRAKKQLVDYSKTLNNTQKSAKGALAAFDNLNVLSKNENTSDSSGGALSGADAFEEVKIGKMSDFAEQLKNALKSGDWQGTAELLAQKVNEVFDDPAVFENAAKNMSDKIKTALSTVRTFIEEVDWGAIGKDIGIFLKNVDWNGIFLELALLIWAAICGMWDFVCGLLDGLGITDKLNELFQWEDVVADFKQIFGGIVDFIAGIFTGDFDRALGGLKDIITGWLDLGRIGVENFLNFIKTAPGEALAFVQNMLSKGSEIIGNIVSVSMDFIKLGIKSALGFISSTWSNIWNKLPEPVRKALSTICDSSKKYINLLLDGIEWLINKIISGINSLTQALSSKINFEVPEILGGGSVGFSIPQISEVSIPHLADGAVIRGGNPFLAFLGDQPAGQTNIEAPLSTMVQAFKQALKEGGYGENASYTFTAQLNGKEMFREVVRQNELYRKSNGGYGAF